VPWLTKGSTPLFQPCHAPVGCRLRADVHTLRHLVAGSFLTPCAIRLPVHSFVCAALSPHQQLTSSLAPFFHRLGLSSFFVLCFQIEIPVPSIPTATAAPSSTAASSVAPRVALFTSLPSVRLPFCHRILLRRRSRAQPLRTRSRCSTTFQVHPTPAAPHDSDPWPTQRLSRASIHPASGFFLTEVFPWVRRPSPASQNLRLINQLCERPPTTSSPTTSNHLFILTAPSFGVRLPKKG
jgi:hypothetical protein